MKEVPVYNIGELREALMGLPDNTRINTQVVFGDGVCWNMYCRFVPQVGGPGTVAALVMDHPQATTPSILPQGVLDQIYGMSRAELQKHSEPTQSSFSAFLEGYEKREKEYEPAPTPPLLLGEFITEVTAYHVQYDQTYNLRPFLSKDDIGRKGGFKIYMDQGRLRLIADGLYC